MTKQEKLNRWNREAQAKESANNRLRRVFAVVESQQDSNYAAFRLSYLVPVFKRDTTRYDAKPRWFNKLSAAQRV